MADYSSSDQEMENEPPDFYDSEADDVDEVWVGKKRKGHVSDAILSCPACLTTLCIDCQRHVKYPTQFRAMFVLNCKIVETEILRMQKTVRKNQRKVDNRKEVQDEDDIFKPVECTECNTRVAVFDSEEVYHFYHVIPSQC